MKILPLSLSHSAHTHPAHKNPMVPRWGGVGGGHIRRPLEFDMGRKEVRRGVVWYDEVWCSVEGVLATKDRRNTGEEDEGVSLLPTP